MNISPKVWTILGTYARAFIAAIVTQYTLGNTSVKALFAAGAASVIPVILRPYSIAQIGARRPLRDDKTPTLV